MKIDSSQLGTWKQCPMKYYLTYVLNLRKRKYDERDLDKEFGSCVHKCLEMWKKNQDTDFAKYWKDYIDLPDIDNAKTAEHGIKLCQSYIERYKNDEYKTLAVEVKDEIALDEDLVWIVKMDRVVERMENIYFSDYKTTGKMSYNYFMNFSPNLQVSGYSYYIWKKYGACSGGLIDVLVCGYRERKYKDQPAGFHYDFKREIVNRTREQLEDFRTDTIKWCKRMQRDLENKDIGKNEFSCHGFRGCQFIALCLTSQGIELDQEIKEVMFEEKDNQEYLKGGENSGIQANG